nr:hypothetical protein [Devosia lucknowensis]
MRVQRLPTSPPGADGTHPAGMVIDHTDGNRITFAKAPLRSDFGTDHHQHARRTDIGSDARKALVLPAR